MFYASHENGLQRLRRVALVLIAALLVLLSSHARAQTPSTGALTGLALDPSGAVLPEVVVRLIHQKTGATDSATSDGEGRFGFLLLPPGAYEVQASKTGSVHLIASATANVRVTETTHLNLRLQLATLIQSTKISAEPTLVQTDSSSLGKVV